MDVILNSIRGRLEGQVSYGYKDQAVLLLHPHPSFGGNMDNKVIVGLYKKMESLGYTVLRFNFRSVNQKLSQQHKHLYFEELSDAAIALDWLQDRNVANFYWVIGFSFGSWIGMQLIMRRPEIRNFAFAGVPINLFNFDFIQPSQAEGLIIQGEKDTIVQIDALPPFIKKLTKLGLDVQYKTIPNADHFFSKHVATLARIVGNYTKSKI